MCCLCGKAANGEDPITREHLPPKQFYPKHLRNGLNLWVVPTHESCNNSYKADEEYFYHVMYPLVAKTNPSMAKEIFGDLKRRAKKPQTRTITRNILKTVRKTTDNGIVLPPGLHFIDADEYRLQRVVIKIGRCLFYRDHERVVPHDNCKDIRFCDREDAVPEIYRLSWDMSKMQGSDDVQDEIIVVADEKLGRPQGSYAEVFSYRSAYIAASRLHYYNLNFWGAFMYCMAFEDPDPSLS